MLMENILTQLISWCLVANVVSGIIVMYMSITMRSDLLQEKILAGAAVVMAVHSLHALIVATFFSGMAYLDWAAPYGLAYGPLLYFAVRTAQGDRHFSRREYFIHAAPFVFYYVLYIVWISSSANKDGLYVLIRYTLFKGIIISFFGYGIYSFYLYKKASLKFTGSLNLLTTAGVMLLIIGFLMISVDSSYPRRHASFYIPRLMMYGMMGLAIFSILDHKLRLLIHPDLSLSSEGEEESSLADARSYAKSGLSEHVLVAYEERLIQAVEGERLFLDPSLNLDLLSELTKIPKHHLSQIFSLQMGKSFADYINQLRIQYACKELEKERDISIEQLGYACGFNSKVSFYRNFKSSTGLTPSQYIAEMRST